jgi:hypothetical protein
MSDERPKAVFNIGSQQGNVSNIAGDMTVYGGQHSVVGATDAIAGELASVRRVLAEHDLDQTVREQADGLMEEADRELNGPEPDADKIAGPIERLTKLLKDSGVMLAAGAALVDPIRSIASLLGVAGRAILHLIG